MADEPKVDTTVSDKLAGQTSPEEFAKLQARYEQAETYIDELKGNQGTLVQKLDEATQRLSTAEGRIDEQRSLMATQQEADVPDPFALEDDDLEKLRGDPAEILKFIQMREEEAALRGRTKDDALIGKLGELFDNQQQANAKDIAALREEMAKASPEKKAWEEVIAKMRENPAYASLADETLIAFAKDKGMQPDYSFQGGPGARMPPASGNGDAAVDMSPEKQNAIFTRYMVLADKDADRAEKLTIAHLKGMGVKNIGTVKQ